MGTFVRRAGHDDTTGDHKAKRMALPTTNGTCIVVVLDPNYPTADYGDKDNVDKIHVYESDTEHKNFQLMASYSLPTEPAKPLVYSADLYSDNSVGVTWGAGGQYVRLVKFNYVDWSIEPAEVISTGAGGSAQWEEFDFAISENDTCALAGYFSDPDSTGTGVYAGVQIFTRTAAAAGWTYQDQMTALPGAKLKPNTAAVSCAWLFDGDPDRHKLIIAFSSTYKGEDYGIEIHGRVFDSAGVMEGTYIEDQYPHIYGPRPGDRWWAGAVNNNYDFVQQARSLYVFGRSNGGFVVTQSTWESKLMKSVWFGPESGGYEQQGHRSGGSGFQRLRGDYGATQTFGDDVVNFFLRTWSPGAHYTVNYYQKMEETGEIIGTRGHFKWNGENTGRALAGGTGRNGRTDTHHDMSLSFRFSATYWRTDHHCAEPSLRPPAGFTPANNSTTISSVPPLSADADIDLDWGQSRYAIVWQFALDSNFTTNLVEYRQPEPKFQHVNGTDQSGVTVRFNDALPEEHSLVQGEWWVRAAHQDEYGNIGDWSDPKTFIIAHPPAAANLSPGNEINLVYGASGEVRFEWTFTDPSSDDFQTAFQIQVERNETDELVYDSGKVTTPQITGQSSHIAQMPASEKDILLRWSVRLYDRDDAEGAWSDYKLFTLVDPPTVDILEPLPGAELASAIPLVRYTTAVGGDRGIESTRVQISQGSVLLEDTGWRATEDQTDGIERLYYPGKVVFENNQAYTITVQVKDTVGLTGSTSVSITTSWITPAPPTGLTVDTVPFNLENEGYVSVQWDDTARDADFTNWNISRKIDVIDPNSLVILEEGTWERIHQDFRVEASYEYRDYFAPSAHRVNYRVSQSVDRFGDLVESEDNPEVESYPRSEGYWVIEPEGPEADADAFRLSNVTSDSYTDEWEEESYAIIGRGRHVDRGERLGLNGSLEAQLRDQGATTARQKKQRLEVMKEQNRLLYLRTPFGDVYRVSVGNLQIGRIAGVGLAEFVDVTIPYVEVGD